MRKGFLFVVITIVTMMLTTTGCADKKASGADSTMTDSTDTTAADTLEQLITEQPIVFVDKLYFEHVALGVPMSFEKLLARFRLAVAKL